MILDEPTAVLTPQETQGLFATLRKAVAAGLSIIFISHKLHEVMAISSRVLVLRHGKLVGELPTAATDQDELAALMVGAALAPAQIGAGAPGPALLALDAVSTAPAPGAPALDAVSLPLHAGQITAIAGVSGNGQAALAALLSGLLLPVRGRLIIGAEAVPDWGVRRALACGIGRIPEDRHQVGTIADFDLTENVILESYADAAFSSWGWMNWGAAAHYTDAIIKTYDVRCPGRATRIRLLSGGNMQKLILGRALEPGPRIIVANQPVRGLDVGAITYIHRRLVAARDAQAAVLLISEDLDEVMELADVIHVISAGRLSPGFARGTMTAAQLGVWMAGQGFAGQRDAP